MGDKWNEYTQMIQEMPEGSVSSLQVSLVVLTSPLAATLSTPSSSSDIAVGAWSSPTSISSRSCYSITVRLCLALLRDEYSDLMPLSAANDRPKEKDKRAEVEELDD